MHNYLPSVLLSLFFFAPGAPKADLPSWAATYGTETPYSSQTHLTGFGMQTIEGNREDALEEAKTRAAADLIRKVRVTVQSEISFERRETESSFSSDFSSVNHTSSNLEMEGIEFEVVNDKKAFYALAYADRRRSSEQYRSAASETLARIKALRNKAAHFEAQNDKEAALEAYLQLNPLFKRYYEQYALSNTLMSTMAKAFDELDGDGGGSGLINPQKLVTWQQDAKQKVLMLLDESADSFRDAVSILVRQLKIQGLKADHNQVLDLQYQDSDFSSQFGSYTAKALKREMSLELSGGETDVITQGYYWNLGEELELSITVINHEGEQLAGAQVRIPNSVVPENLKLKPRNFEQALKEKNMLLDENLVDGGINVEVMSDKGANNKSVVLKEGEEINFYFRVNQPSYLQLTYILSSGEKIMLWDSYYIGEDRVNKMVAFPYTFEATPPLGVERLIVRAYSEEPPEPNTVNQSIAREEYKVITDEVSEMLAKTRGLKMKNKNKIRVGVADLSITTIPN